MNFRMTIRILLLTALSIPLLPAQEKKPDHQLRVLPVGKAPPMRISIQEGVRRELDPPKGAIPPQKIHALTDLTGSDLNLKLNKVSPNTLLRFKESRIAALLSAPPVDDAPPADPWVKLKIPSGSATLAILFQSPDSKNWDKPKSLTLPDSRSAFPGGTIRFTNVSPVPILIRVGNKAPFALAPGKYSLSPAVTGTADIPIHLVVREADGTVRNVLRTTVNLDPKRRANIVSYWGKPDHSRRPPVHACITREHLPTPR